ncbi:MAG TPA: GerMN domain-containing protein, partial [Anaerolineaceae bacterium]|nr:GerMN domain-containing protein [Anaerolineaceae bacterium]
GESGLYNALYQSDLNVDSLTIVDGAATLRLTGQLMLGGVCDNPRVLAQIVRTLTHNPDVESAEVFINDTPLEDLLSGQ